MICQTFEIIQNGHCIRHFKEFKKMIRVEIIHIETDYIRRIGYFLDLKKVKNTVPVHFVLSRGSVCLMLHEHYIRLDNTGMLLQLIRFVC
jgi:hypothetical protein